MPLSGPAAPEVRFWRLTMNGFGAYGDEVTLQPGPTSVQLYRCPTCKRIDWCPFRPMCNGTLRSSHPEAQAELISHELAPLINPDDPPSFY